MPTDNPQIELDELDLKIISLLQRDGRISIPDMATEVNTSKPTAYARFNRLVESGVISGFHAQIDPHHLGLEVGALLSVTVEQADWRSVRDELSQDESVVWLGLGAGHPDFAMLVRARDLSHLRDVILERLLQTAGVKSIVTSILLDEHQKLSLIHI